MLESEYQAQLRRKIEKLLPGCYVFKNDPEVNMQGVPDLTVLYHDRWGMLEVKANAKAPYQPNQEYYLEKFHEMSFSATIYPENEEEVLNELQRSLTPRRNPRVPKRK